MVSVKQGCIKYHFLSLWYDSTRNWTQVSGAICEHSKDVRFNIWAFTLGSSGKGYLKTKVPRVQRVTQKVFVSGQGDWGSIYDWVIQTTQKWYLMPLCFTFSFIRYVSRVSGAIQEKTQRPPLPFDIVAIEKRTFGSPLPMGWIVYIYIYICVCVCVCVRVHAATCGWQKRNT